MASDRRVPVVAQGGFYHSPAPQYSKDTHQMLRQMMQESKLTNFQQRKINDSLKGGQSLPSECPATSSARLRRPVAQKASNPKVLNPRNYSGGVRTRSMIENSGAYEKSAYRPTPVRGRTDAEKDRLSNLMAYGEEVAPGKGAGRGRNIPGTPPSPEPEKDRFDELVEEVEERQNFLEEMEELGQGKKYRPIIETEISKLVREMEVIDKRRTAELERAIHAQQQARK